MLIQMLELLPQFLLLLPLILLVWIAHVHSVHSFADVIHGRGSDVRHLGIALHVNASGI